jgi:adenosylmethionine-8-amino-7-oxononanoate aminotransferase
MSVFYKWGGGLYPDHPTVAEAHDEFLVLDTGEEIIDGASGAAVVNLGHSVSGVAERMAEQTNDVGYMSLSYFSNEPAEDLAAELERRTPRNLNSVFLVNSGSEANEAAIKLARAYHVATGNPQKETVISRWQSYHGSTIATLSASGNTSRRTEYQPLLKSWPHIPPAYPYRWDYTGTPEEQAVAAARELETAIKQEGAETVAAFIAEPVSGASIPAAHPHPAYFEEIRRICDEYDVLFIADEVMTGFGRTGEMFAVDHFDVVPDMLSLGKGISGGYAPISGLMVHDDIAAEFESGEGNEFNHGHTFCGHPVASAVAAHVTSQYDDDLVQTGADQGERLVSELAPLEDHPMVGDFRSIGLMIGLEFVADREAKTPFDRDLDVNKRVYEEALERGVYTYPGSGSVDGRAGDHLMLAPPLTVSTESIEEIASVVVDSVETVANDLDHEIT